MRSLTAATPAILLALLVSSPTSGTAQDSGHAHEGHEASPYTDLRDREIKTLADEDIQALLAGEGMGMALAAELNAYPGPRHVLELADSLALTPDQRAATEAAMQQMQERARALGNGIVATERELDAAFAAGTITAGELIETTSALGRMRGELRAVHLTAHLTVQALLTRHQVHRYQMLRGYVDASEHEHEMGGGARP